MKRHEFQKVLREGTKTETKNFFVYMSPNDFSKNRLGIIASRKAGGAVIRNRAKRLVKEYFRNLSRELKGKDVVFICKRSRNYLSFQSVGSDFEKACGKNDAVCHQNISAVS